MKAVVTSGIGAFLRHRGRAVLFASVAALALAGCNGSSGPGPNARSMKRLSPETVALIQSKGMSQDSPVVVRIFKEESELEVWKQKSDGEYALLKTYPICRWSGELGPKVKEGDRQAPEGFYTITPGQMNPNSNYYLAFNMGFPNAYDRAWGRTGANLMVHGDCSSSGCYAMTDEQIQEIFALGRDSFMGGQRSFQVQAYPFRMTPKNMARHRDNPNMPFWRMIKEGYDTFEITKLPPKVDVCNKRYVFNATPADPAQRFEPSAACPPYSVPDDLEQQLAAKRAADDRAMAMMAPLTPVEPVKTGKDGGMNEVFLAKLRNPSASAPGSLPPVVKPPGLDYGVATNAPADIPLPGVTPPGESGPSPADSVALATADVPVPMARPADAPAGTPSETQLFARGLPATPTTQVAAVAPADDSSSLLSSVARLLGRSDSAESTVQGSPAVNAANAASSGFSLGRLFGQEEAPPALTPAQATLPAEVPTAPVRPIAPGETVSADLAPPAQ